MLELLLVRHAETDGNAAGIFRGRADLALNDTGVAQAGLLGEFLAEVKLHAVYSSPLQRALKTAAAIASHQALEVSIVPGLIDLDFGEWQGLSGQEVKKRYPKLYADWLSQPGRVKVPGGENLEEVRRRALAVVAEILSRHGEGRVVLVSHRVINKVLICAMLGLDNTHFWNILVDTCGLTSFSCERGMFILNRHNDTSFLKSIRKAPLGDF